MKKIFLLPLAVLTLFSSCKLDLEPENALTYTNSFRTERELNTTTTSIHFYINTTVGNNPTFTLAGLKVDEVQGSEQVRQWNPRSVMSTDNTWKGLYDLIFESNLLLDNIHRTENLSQDRANYHKGQAEFGLGLGYFLVAQRYGDAIITENSWVIKAYPASPQLEVVNTAIAHALKAYDLLPTYDKLRDIDGMPITNRQVASKGTCAALLAHLYAWKGSIIDLYGLPGNAQEAYTKSVEYATRLIEGKAGNYSLCANPETLCQFLSDPSKTNPEVVFSLLFDKIRSADTSSPNEVARGFVSWPVDENQTPADIAVNPSYRLYKSTIDALFPDATDLRRKAFFYEIDQQHKANGIDYAVMYKFRTAVMDPDQSSQSGKVYRTINANYVYWRLADFYLLRAECYAKLGNTASAEADLNVIRNRAGALTYPSLYDTEGLQKAIFREREKEFIAENDSRYADILRNNYVKDELQGKFTVLTKREIKDGALVLPIPPSAWQDRDGHITNTVIRQKPYWQAYQ